MKTIELRASAEQDNTELSITGDAVFVENPDYGNFSQATYVLDVTALATETGDKLDVYIDVSPDGSTWFNAVHFTQLDGDGSATTEHALVTLGTQASAPVNVTSDAAEATVRNLGFYPYIRYRGAITQATTNGNEAFTYSVMAYFE